MAERPGHHPPPPLSVWSVLWRYAVASGTVLLALLVWVAAAIPGAATSGDPLYPSTGHFALDLGIAAVALVLMHFRRRRPLPVAVLLTLAGTVSVAASGAATVVVVSLSTRRRWTEILTVTGVHLVGSALYLARGWDGRLLPVLAPLTFQMLAFAMLVFVGLYIGARRDLLASLRERAETAEREQLMRVQQARVGERARIAREMHDVMAHRVSLVALHDDALAFREDLSAGQMREAAQVIQQNAYQALTELREVLGALRQDEDAADAPQPTLAAVDALLADARDLGQRIDAQVDIDTGTIQERISRDAFRILQEALTNARKHAPGARVQVLMSLDTTGPEPGLRILVSNPLAPGQRPTPGAQVGLIGLRERVEMAAGTLDHGLREERFVLDGWLPTTPARTPGALL